MDFRTTIPIIINIVPGLDGPGVMKHCVCLLISTMKILLYPYFGGDETALYEINF